MKRKITEYLGLEELVDISSPEGAGDIHYDYTGSVTDVVEEVEAIEDEIAETSHYIDEGIDVSNTLSDQLKKNSEILEGNPSDVTAASVMESQEALFIAMGRLGIPRDTINLSYEYSNTNYERLQASNEGIGNILKTIWEKIKAFFRWVWEKITNFFKAVGKFFGLYQEEEKVLDRLKRNVQELTKSGELERIADMSFKEALNNSNVKNSVKNLFETIDEIGKRVDAINIPVETEEEINKRIIKQTNEKMEKRKKEEETLKEKAQKLYKASVYNLSDAVSRIRLLSHFPNYDINNLTSKPSVSALLDNVTKYFYEAHAQVSTVGKTIKEASRIGVENKTRDNNVLDIINRALIDKFDIKNIDMQSFRPDKYLSSAHYNHQEYQGRPVIMFPYTANGTDTSLWYYSVVISKTEIKFEKGIITTNELTGEKKNIASHINKEFKDLFFKPIPASVFQQSFSMWTTNRNDMQKTITELTDYIEKNVMPLTDVNNFGRSSLFNAVDWYRQMLNMSYRSSYNITKAILELARYQNYEHAANISGSILDHLHERLAIIDGLNYEK